MSKMKYAVMIKLDGEIVFTAIGQDGAQAKEDINQMLEAIQANGATFASIEQPEVHGPGIPLTEEEHAQFHRIVQH